MHQQTHQLARPRLRSSMMRLMEAGVVLLANRSKSRQKVEESSKSSKNLKGLKSCKGHRFGGTFTKAPILRQRTRASVTTLIVFQALFAGPRSSLNTTFTSIIVKTKLGVTLFLSEELVFFEPLCTEFLSAKLASSLRLILEMRSERRRPSP